MVNTMMLRLQEQEQTLHDELASMRRLRLRGIASDVDVLTLELMCKIAGENVIRAINNATGENHA